MSFDATKPSVFITGCSTGIGAAAAERMKKLGWNVFASARKPTDLDRLETEGFHAIPLDVSDAESVTQAVQMVRDLTGGVLQGLVNNAGYGQPGALEDLTRDQMRRQFEVNVFGMQQVTNECLPMLRAAEKARIVNISSVVGRVSLPFFGIYSASKFAMEAMSDALRVELKGEGIEVILVEPGPIETRFRDTATERADQDLNMEGSRFAEVYQQEIVRRNEQGNPEDRWKLPPEAVADAIARALTSRSPALRYPVTLPAFLAPVLNTILPQRWVDALLYRRWAKCLRRPS